jgi:hypothetical protein
MHHDDATEPAAPAVPADASAPQPGTERFGDLAELEAEIRRRLRSNQRFLDRFLDEDFVDDEADGEEAEAEDDAAEL